MRVICSVALAAAFASAAERPIDFQREIRPILSDACFHCHGPDKNTRLMGLRLDTREGAFEQRKSGAVIAPGKPEASLLYQRIAHTNDALRMPPSASTKTLTEAQKTLVKKWIEQGAPWKEHWSFAPPARPQLPAVRNMAWVRNPIDRFILQKLEAAGLKPSPEADRRALIRRASLDVTGLPPAPAEVEAFVADASPNAYEKALDRMLASRRYGEHRARYWLDAARYGDTHGIHIDNYREMWPYRDWVINAFNSNIPFDRFTIEQLAGDLLPNRTPLQQIASGFHRCNVTTNEGGSITEEVEAMYAKDRVETTAIVWLGLTAGCASCHDHKFDPLSQRDFYRLAAFFRNTTQHAMDGNIPDTPPILFVPKPEEEKRWQELNAEITRLNAARSARREAAATDFDRWQASRRMPAEPLHDAPLLRVSPAEVPATQGIAAGTGPASNTPGFHFSGKVAAEVPAGAFRLDRPFTISFWMLMPTGEDAFTVVSQTVPKPGKRDDDDEATLPTGWSVDLFRRVPTLRFGNENFIRATAINTDQMKPGTWNHLTFTYDGSRDQRGLMLYMNGKPSSPPNKGTNLQTELKGELQVAAPIRLGGEGTRFFNGGAIADFRIYQRSVRPEEAGVLARWPALQQTQAERAQLFDYFLTRVDPEHTKLNRDFARIDEERNAMARRAALTHVMEEKRDSQPAAHMLYRGMYDQPRDRVDPGTPAVLPPMAAALPRNRLGLAQWMVDPANPLPARVTVNRMWQELFGTGIVKTSEDFGSQGQPPSHSELLDWLAVDFRENGWDMKRLYKMMLMSAAYRQSAAATEEKLKVDPDNRLLSRGPRFRMDGEMVRDLFLAAGGLMTSDIGGPSVKPYQPEGIWETVAMKGSNTRFYKQDHGDKLYRRSLYTFWKRAAPPASMEIFNAPTRETCTVRRERTNTPLQALVTMNDPQMVEAARNLAQRVLRSGATAFDSRLDALTMAAIARQLNARERAVVRGELTDLLAHYDSKPAEAKKLLKVGESTADAALPTPEFAAWTMIASNILNLDEALNK